jgi:glycosyltransferase involved in cell wall biosynthesis
MQIAMFMPELAPGALGSLVYRDLARAFTALGHSFDCLGSDSASDSDGVWPRPLPLSPLWERMGALGAPLLRTRRIVAYAAALTTWLRRHGTSIDVLHIEIAYPTGAAAALAAAWSGWKGVLSISPMGEDVLILPEASYGFRRYAVPRAVVAWTMRRANVIRAISPLMLALVRKEWPQIQSQAVPLNVVRRAIEQVEETTEARTARRAAARRALQERHRVDGRRLVLSLGRLHPFKGIDRLIEALPALPDAHALIAGPSLSVQPFGDTAAHLRALASRLGVAERVSFLGKVPPADALELLAGADVLVVPSRLESMNRVCVEAAAVGTPFVVTPTTGVTGWLSDAGAGVVAASGDVDSIASAIGDVLEGRFAWEARLAAEFVRRFAPEQVAAELIELYSPLVARR